MRELNIVASSDFNEMQEELVELRKMRIEFEKTKQNNSLLRRKVETLKAKLEKKNKIIDDFIKEIKGVKDE